jgi:hypothetical protein
VNYFDRIILWLFVRTPIINIIFEKKTRVSRSTKYAVSQKFVLQSSYLLMLLVHIVSFICNAWLLCDVNPRTE